MIVDRQPPTEPRRATCPHCREPIEVLPDGLLAFHFGLPGVGLPCPTEVAGE